jgi:hypothetical protein
MRHASRPTYGDGQEEDEEEELLEALHGGGAARRGAASTGLVGLDQAPRRGECWTSIGLRQGADVQVDMQWKGSDEDKEHNVRRPIVDSPSRWRQKSRDTSTKVDFTPFNPLGSSVSLISSHHPSTHLICST